MTTRRVTPADEAALAPRIFRRVRTAPPDLSAKNCKQGPGLAHAVAQMISVADNSVFRAVQLVVVEEAHRRAAA